MTRSRRARSRAVSTTSSAICSSCNSSPCCARSGKKWARGRASTCWIKPRRSIPKRRRPKRPSPQTSRLRKRPRNPGMTTPLIEVVHLRKAFGRHRVLKGIDMSIEAGSSVVMFGPNGAGKTTFLRILSTLSKPTSGTVRVSGVDIKNNPEGIRQYLGLVSHAPLLYDDLTAYENLRFYARLYDLDAPHDRIRELLERVGLWHRRHDLVRTFSRGMVQRMAIARALLHNP
ncbi:MAG TPA: ABC transporter ATP-binding protein, partial [Anaerolineae bacterium]|nr:ABC transporter ATP-binding protein [Anaerolineae bacterium]